MRKVMLLATIVGLVVGTAQAGLPNHWAMDEGSGFITADSGTGGNDGVFQEDANAAANPGEGPTFFPLTYRLLWFCDSLERVIITKYQTLGRIAS